MPDLPTPSARAVWVEQLFQATSPLCVGVFVEGGVVDVDEVEGEVAQLEVAVLAAAKTRCPVRAEGVDALRDTVPRDQLAVQNEVGILSKQTNEYLK